eukprot:4126182-Prymnesium_polylepis.1
MSRSASTILPKAQPSCHHQSNREISRTNFCCTLVHLERPYNDPRVDAGGTPSRRLLPPRPDAGAAGFPPVQRRGRLQG